MLDIKETIVETRSYRSFNPDAEVLREELVEMIDCARISASAANKQPLKYRICTDEAELSLMLENTRLGAMLPELKLPPEGHEAKAYIVICRDKTICDKRESCLIDVGIAAQSIMLAATTMGLGGCMVGNFNREAVAEGLMLPRTVEPELVLIIGKPDETCLICLPGKDKGTAYFRDAAGLHFVPKRPMDEILL